MKKVWILFLLTVVFFTGQPIKGQVPDKFKVEVQVSCKNHIIRDLVSSYIKRELRSLNDVEINSASDYKLKLIVMEPNHVVTGVKTGYVIISGCFYQGLLYMGYPRILCFT